jgi:hypothetical protein
VCRKVETKANMLQVPDLCRSRNIDQINSQLRIDTIICCEWVFLVMDTSRL